MVVRNEKYTIKLAITVQFPRESSSFKELLFRLSAIYTTTTPYVCLCLCLPFSHSLRGFVYIHFKFYSFVFFRTFFSLTFQRFHHFLLRFHRLHLLRRVILHCAAVSICIRTSYIYIYSNYSNLTEGFSISTFSTNGTYFKIIFAKTTQHNKTHLLPPNTTTTTTISTHYYCLRHHQQQR